MKVSSELFPLLFITVLFTCIAAGDIRADAPSFGGRECVVKCCDKASGAKDYTGCKSACEKASDREKCRAECSEKMQKAYQACLMEDCRMDKYLAPMTIKCAK